MASAGGGEGGPWCRQATRAKSAECPTEEEEGTLTIIMSLLQYSHNTDKILMRYTNSSPIILSHYSHNIYIILSQLFNNCKKTQTQAQHMQPYKTQLTGDLAFGNETLSTLTFWRV